MSNKLDLDQASVALATMVTDEVVDQALQAMNLPVSGTLPERCKVLITASGVRSQGDLVVLIVNHTHGEGLPLDADEVTRVLAAAFPGAKVGKRHGPHYISLARSGKLKGLREDLTPIPHMRRKAAAKPAEAKTTDAVETVTEETAALTAEAIEAMTERDDLIAAAKELGVKATGKVNALRKRCLAALAA